MILDQDQDQRSIFAQKGSKIVYFCQKVPFLKAKIYRNLSLSGQKLSIMILENSSDYRYFDNDKLSIANSNTLPPIDQNKTLPRRRVGANMVSPGGGDQF
jgi:hypothetical protein